MAMPKVIEMDNGFFCVDPECDEAKYVASRLPGYDFKNVPSFFDVGGICADPEALKIVTNIFYQRYKDQNISSICGLDARGFIFGPLVAQALMVPFFMLRKQGKLPGPVMECPYETEYSSEVLTIPCSSVKPGDRVVIFDDLIATGGTTIASANLICEAGGEVAEVAVITAIAFFKGWQKFRSSLPKLANVPIFSIVEAGSTPCMPPGSQPSFVVKANSDEHKAMVEAMKTAELGAVLCKQEDGTYTAEVPDTNQVNQAYLAEGEHLEGADK
eukprot:TRINITY_DN26387_c0_g1_i1.p1 TRINITY_DN26387_c0_g1~~TRINITY_DN26387_c0_g1_i1.p1  ORF type:complete len:272 (-),score=75.56 TRINITY_DN26387_c0_g1_i1:220-1035(-)